MRYRPEIDGLRAVAVVPVVLFHAGFSIFSGGYVGVDVFFVISGYLITTVILGELQKGTFSIAGFYERRARRILPALFVVLTATVPFAWLSLWPNALRKFFESLMSVVLFVSNIFFWRERGYFDAVGELKPLLHTWSLAVEEQFYLLFPLTLILAWKVGRRYLAAGLVLASIISFGLAEWASIFRPGAAFFLIVTRAWELLIGALAAVYLRRSEGEAVRLGRVASEAGAAAGLLGIGAAIVLFDASTPFPGVFALIPTVGAVLIILFANRDTFIGRLLSVKVMVGIGLISYSLYLWHQPMLAIARNRTVSEPDALILGLICLAAVPISYLNWKYIETPFRDRKRFSRRQIFTFAGIGSAVLLAVGIAGYQLSYLGRQLPANVQWEDLGQKIETLGDVCATLPLSGFAGIEVCYFGDTEAEETIALYGDSHARAISWELDRELKRRQIRGVRILLPGCETVPGVIESRAAAFLPPDQCRDSFTAALSYLEKNVSEVLVLSRWSYFLYPVEGEIETLSFDNREGGFERNTRSKYGVISSNGSLTFDGEAKRMALRELLTSFAALPVPVIVVYPIPEVGWDIAKLNAQHYDDSGAFLQSISTSYQLYKERNAFAVSVLSEFQGFGSLRFVKPDEIFCDTFIAGRCIAQWDSVPFYDDDDHLSDIGSKMLIDNILQKAEMNK